MPLKRISKNIYARGPEKILHGVFHVGGRQIWRSLGTKDEKKADLVYARKLIQLSDPRALDGVKDIPWADFRKEYLDHRKREQRLRTYETDVSTLNLFEKAAYPATTLDITPINLQLFKKERQKDGVKALTVNRNLISLRAMVTYCKEWGYVDKNADFAIVKDLAYTKKIMDFYELEEMAKICEAAATKPLKVQLIVNVAKDTGMRTEEMLHLRPRDVDFEEKIIRVAAWGDWRPKDSEEREIPLYPDCERVLKAYIQLLAIKPDRPIFTHEDGRVMARDFMNRKFKEIRKEAGISKGTLYTLKHTFLTHIADKLDIVTVQHIAGHSDLKTTRGYLHLRKKAIREAVKTPPYAANP